MSKRRRLGFMSPHSIAVIEALFVTFLWSSSYVLIKMGLSEIPALTFAGLRYFLAFLCLFPFALRSDYRTQFRELERNDWFDLGLLGLIYYTVTQGAQFAALLYIPAVTVSLMLNFTPVIVTFMAIKALNERPTARQWIGISIAVAGSLVYFYPVDIPFSELLGLGIMFVGLLSNAGSSVLGRKVNRDEEFPALVVTTASMGIGSLALLITGVAFQGLPSISLQGWVIVVWLAVVNTAFAFTLWNRTLQTLKAVESSVINNTMLVQIAVLGWIFLGETLTLIEVIGLAIVGGGTLLVQIARS